MKKKNNTKMAKTDEELKKMNIFTQLSMRERRILFPSSLYNRLLR